MQKHLMLEFKSLFGQHGNTVRQMCCVNCLSCLSEKFTECIGFCLVLPLLTTPLMILEVSICAPYLYIYAQYALAVTSVLPLRAS